MQQIPALMKSEVDLTMASQGSVFKIALLVMKSSLLTYLGFTPKVWTQNFFSHDFWLECTDFMFTCNLQNID